MRVLRASLLASLLTVLIAVPVAVAAQSHGPGRGGMPALPGMQLESPEALGLGGRQGPAPRAADAGRPGSARPNGAQPGGRSGPVGGTPLFRVNCGMSHTAMDDPIVFPGQPGKSHQHTFVGNVSTDASSTAATLLAARTTCDDRADLSAYWMPSLVVGGETVAPTFAYVAYRRVTAAQVTAFPAGFRMIAGNSRASAAQLLSVAAWTCGRQSGIAPSATPPTCPDAAENGLRLRVTFPSCWDGTSLDSADHTSHVAYPVAGVCPTTHPVAVPELSINYIYPSQGGATAVLASGGTFSAHADFMNAWRPGTLERLVDRRLNRPGQGGQGGQGRPGDRPQGPPASGPAPAPSAPPVLGAAAAV